MKEAEKITATAGEEMSRDSVFGIILLVMIIGFTLAYYVFAEEPFPRRVRQVVRNIFKINA